MARQLPKKVEKTNARVRMLILITLFRPTAGPEKRLVTVFTVYIEGKLPMPDSNCNKESSVKLKAIVQGSIVHVFSYSFQFHSRIMSPRTLCFSPDFI